jgi:5'-3' exonuclease
LFFLPCSFFLSSIVKNTKGIGLKTASALLNHFGTVEAMYERLGLPSILQSLLQVDEQTAQLHAIEGNDGDFAIPSSSTSFRQSKTTPTNDMETKVTVNDGDRDGDGDMLEVSNVDTRAIDALFARINAASALTKKTNKKTTKSKKKDGILLP